MMADVAPPFPADRPPVGARWTLGICGCVGTVELGALCTNGEYTYFVSRVTPENCSGDKTLTHWGVRPGLPGVGPTGEPTL